MYYYCTTRSTCSKVADGAKVRLVPPWAAMTFILINIYTLIYRTVLTVTARRCKSGYTSHVLLEYVNFIVTS